MNSSSYMLTHSCARTRLFAPCVLPSNTMYWYDHVDPIGAFQKKSAIDMKSSIRVIRDFPSVSESLMNALRYSTKHFNDETTPKAIKDLLT